MPDTTPAELADVPRTADQAAAAGWTVDRHCYPWVAYTGPRFNPDRITEIDTPAFTTSHG